MSAQESMTTILEKLTTTRAKMCDDLRANDPEGKLESANDAYCYALVWSVEIQYRAAIVRTLKAQRAPQELVYVACQEYSKKVMEIKMLMDNEKDLDLQDLLGCCEKNALLIVNQSKVIPIEMKNYVMIDETKYFICEENQKIKLLNVINPSHFKKLSLEKKRLLECLQIRKYNNDYEARHSKFQKDIQTMQNFNAMRDAICEIEQFARLDVITKELITMIITIELEANTTKEIHSELHLLWVPILNNILVTN